ncbi:hypothetical protein E2C01_019540 [Portunus trituberculatus]|uniref:Uncharacterized protein n=1 Tax=Portunus trituberculatus TaxID=210409 RepID=A0A5B7DXH3_PORTR|nr:hypothetical protein [Portunus trituberculatus]
MTNATTLGVARSEGRDSKWRDASCRNLTKLSTSLPSARLSSVPAYLSRHRAHCSAVVLSRTPKQSQESGKGGKEAAVTLTAMDTTERLYYLFTACLVARF